MEKGSIQVICLAMLCLNKILKKWCYACDYSDGNISLEKVRNPKDNMDTG